MALASAARRVAGRLARPAACVAAALPIPDDATSMDLEEAERSWPAPPAFSLEEQIDSMAIQAKEVLGCPGLALAVAERGHVLYARGVGFADVENLVPMTPNTHCRIASISKSLTAVVAARLVEIGKLDLDRPVCQLVPWWPCDGDKGKVTSRQLLAHRGGVRTYQGREFFCAQPFHSVEASAALFRDSPLASPPGERYLYSTFGYTLLSAAMEGAAGKKFRPLMTEMLFKPLHMTETRVERKRRLENDCARYYTRTGKRNKRQLRKAPYADLTAKIAGGGYVSTCMDLLRFAAALCAVPRSASPIVSAATRELLFAPVGDNYGLGWATLRDPLAPGGRWVYHTGGAVGASSIVLLNPEAEIAVTALTNIDDVSLKPLALRVARATLRSSGRVAPTV